MNEYEMMHFFISQANDRLPIHPTCKCERCEGFRKVIMYARAWNDHIHDGGEEHIIEQ